MAVGYSALAAGKKKLLMYDKKLLNHLWAYRKSKTSASCLPELAESSLEEEIQKLRLRMERIFLQEKSLTSPNVVNVSRELDLKIYEFMLLHQSR